MAYYSISIKPYIKSHLELQREITPVILLPAHPASFAHKFLFQRVQASPGMQQYCRLVIENSVLDS